MIENKVMPQITFEQLIKRNYASAKTGVFGCGDWMYWRQFEGLRDKLVGHRTFFENRLRENGSNIFSRGLVDDSQSGAAAGDMFRREGVEFLFCFVSTYALYIR